MESETNRALENAKAHLASIVAAATAWDFLQGELDGRDLSREAKALLREHGYDGTDADGTADAITEAMREDALSVEVRSEWHTPGTEADDAEFCILLSTGGPASRLIGDLGRYCAPENPRLQWQDWFTPWTDCDTDSDDDAALIWFASLFYFGA